MDFDYTAEENAFREEVRNFISENLPPKKERDKNFLNTWLEKVRAKGWVGFSWPKEFGGSAGGLNRTNDLARGNGAGQSTTIGHLDDGARLGRPRHYGIRHRRAKTQVHSGHPRQQGHLVYRLLRTQSRL